MRATPGWVRLLRLSFVVLTLVTIGIQTWQSVVVRGFPITNLFSFFTVQSNLIAAAVLLWGALAPPAPARVRGAAVLYLSLTGIVYGLLLADLQADLQTMSPWIDTVLHRLMPLVMLVDWLADPPQVRLSVRSALIWLAYPLLYVLYTLVRGPFADWYPYPFLNPALSGGYPGVFAYCIVIALGVLVFAWLVVQIGNRLRLTTTPVRV